MGSNVGTLLARRALLDPDAIALVFERKAFTYRQLNALSNRWGHAFLGLGAKKGDRVGILLKNCNEFLEAYFGLAKIGAVLVPLDWRLTSPELELLCDNSGLQALIFGMDLTPSVEAIKPNVMTRNYVCVGLRDNLAPTWAKDAELFIARFSPTEPRISASGEDPLFIQYTSGTTGHPNGCVISHENHFLTCSKYSQVLDFRLARRVLLPIPLFHGFGLAYATGSFNAGCMNVLMGKFDPLSALRIIRKEKIQTFPAVPTILQSVAQVPDFEKYTSSLRFVTSGGAQLSIGLIKAYARHGIKVRNLYGLNEGGPISATTLKDAVRKAGSAGLALFDNVVRIVGDDGVQIRAGEIGEILVKGPTVMTEYWKNPEATRERIREDWVHTGDLGFFDGDGYLYLVDRKEDRIVSGAEKIFPVEIENVLCSHPKIAEAAAVGVPDELWGEVICAVVRTKAGETLNPGEIIDFCEGRLARFKIPKRVYTVDSPLPRNTTGKLLRRLLRDELRSKNRLTNAC